MQSHQSIYSVSGNTLYVVRRVEATGLALISDLLSPNSLYSVLRACTFSTKIAAATAFIQSSRPLSEEEIQELSLLKMPGFEEIMRVGCQTRLHTSPPEAPVVLLISVARLTRLVHQLLSSLYFVPVHSVVSVRSTSHAVLT
jgi:hypothetical protein